MDSEARLRVVAEAPKLTFDTPPIRLSSDSNDAWKIGALVLRVCWRGDRTRLHREALILQQLPDEVPHVRLADVGVADDLTWTLTRWVPGTTLFDGWATQRYARYACAGTRISFSPCLVLISIDCVR